MRSAILAVDISNLLYRSCHSYRQLTSGDTFTGGIYGVMTLVAKAINSLQVDRVVICRDMKPYIRSEVYPEYKALRQESKDPVLAELVKDSLALVLEFCQVVGWPVWAVPGFESDDLVAHLAIKYRHRFDRIIAMSNDSDLFQLFSQRGFSIWRGQRGHYTKEDYDKEWGLTSEQFKWALAFIGTHNDVEGVKGIGPVKAREIVLDASKLRLHRDTHRKVVERNYGLISLPYGPFPRTASLPTPTSAYSERVLIRWAGQLDINLTKDMAEAFDRVGR